jgi:hypothetical protein
MEYARIREHRSFLLVHIYAQSIEQLEESAVAYTRIAGALARFRDVIERLNEVPGLGRIAIKTHHRRNRDPFLTGGQLVSWAGLAPQTGSPTEFETSAIMSRSARRPHCCAVSF